MALVHQYTFSGSDTMDTAEPVYISMCTGFPYIVVPPSIPLGLLLLTECKLLPHLMSWKTYLYRFPDLV